MGKHILNLSGTAWQWERDGHGMLCVNRPLEGK